MAGPQPDRSRRPRPSRRCGFWPYEHTHSVHAQLCYGKKGLNGASIVAPGLLRHRREKTTSVWQREGASSAGQPRRRVSSAKTFLLSFNGNAWMLVVARAGSGDGRKNNRPSSVRCLLRLERQAARVQLSQSLGCGRLARSPVARPLDGADPLAGSSSVDLEEGQTLLPPFSTFNADNEQKEGGEKNDTTLRIKSFLSISSHPTN